MNPCSEDIKDILVAEDGLTFGTDLFIGLEPTSPNNCTTIYDTYGYSPSLNLVNNEVVYRPSIQIRVRNNSYLTGWAVLKGIVDVLHGKSHETWNGSVYELIHCATEPALLDYDENGLPRFVANFNIIRKSA